MNNLMKADTNLLQTVPFLVVEDMAKSIAFYVDKLSFEIEQKWTQDGKLRWCWLQQGGAALMLQEFPKQGHDAWVPEGIVGEGVSIYFICKDAVTLYREIVTHIVDISKPIVGNGMWVTGITDPDGYQLYFESPTDTPEGTVYEYNGV
jgi:lactoylglutathione lyase